MNVEDLITYIKGELLITNGELKKLHIIDPDICIRCSIGKQFCNYKAVTVL